MNNSIQVTNSNETNTDIRPFRISVAKSEIDDLKNRLRMTRWPKPTHESSWQYGVSMQYVKELAEYWLEEYDWGKYEEILNQYPQFTTTVDGAPIHFLHVRSPEPNAFPLLLTHGWPSSIVEFVHLIGPLSDPRSYGLDPNDAFHLVIPSVPGFGFSGPDLDSGWDTKRIAQAWDTLMQRLGYKQYGSHGSDVGALVSREMGIQKPEGLRAIHVLQLFSFPSGDPAEMADLSEDDMGRLQFLGQFQQRAGFNVIQASRPQTLSYGLTDSPAGLLAWIAELFNGFGDHIDFIDRDLLLTNVTLYWLTNTAESSIRLYYENARQEQAHQPNDTPTGLAVFGNDFKSIKRFAERDNTNITHWKEYERGTHFAALDEPKLLTSDIQAFFRTYR